VSIRMIALIQQTITRKVYIHVSVHRHCILKSSNKMQQTQVFIYCKITLHVSGVYRTHHLECIKLYLQLLVQFAVLEKRISASVA